MRLLLAHLHVCRDICKLQGRNWPNGQKRHPRAAPENFERRCYYRGHSTIIPFRGKKRLLLRTSRVYTHLLRLAGVTPNAVALKKKDAVSVGKTNPSVKADARYQINNNISVRQVPGYQGARYQVKDTGNERLTKTSPLTSTHRTGWRKI